ncbi:MAG: type II toxin-antitoxin system HicB family antitoxin [Chloroflexi bacterium]|nr:type II toxin-antitoxin system HicB family antitoxin [Chloroflexota bacterium]
MRYDVLIHPDPDSGFYLAEVPDLPGCVSQGRTVEEAKAAIQEAIQGHVEVLRDLGRDVPPPSHHVLDTVEVSVA